MDKVDPNPYSPRPRKSLRSAAEKLSHKTTPNSSYKYDRSKDYYSDDESSDEDKSFEYSSQNVSISSKKSVHESVEFIDYETRQQRISALNKEQTKKYIDQRNETETKLTNPKVAFVLVILFSIFAGILGFLLIPSRQTYVRRIECSQFKQLAKDHSNQDKSLWRSLKVGIENVVNQTPPNPSVFLLAYTNAESSKNLMTKILNATANCMNSRNPIKLEGSTFVTDAMVKDYGEIIAAYRPRLQNEGILYVHDIHKIPAQAAQAFHAICDTVTPLVEKSVIFLTMHIEQSDREIAPQEIHRLVETKLENNWININKNTLKALIGRVTDQVFLLH